MQPWIQNVCFALLGGALGIGADEIKRWLSRRSELTLAKREIYDELAAYIADLGQLNTSAFDFATYRRIREDPPELDVIDWYRTNRFDLLLRLDAKKGIRLLHREIKSSLVQRLEKGGIPGQSGLFQKVSNGSYRLDNAYLQKRMALIRTVKDVSSDCPLS